MRLIDADALFNWGSHEDGFYALSDAVKYGNEDAAQQHFSYSTMMMYEIAGEIDNAPTIDAVPVVRCEECEHEKTCDRHMVIWRLGPGAARPEVAFCSCGKRRE